MRPQPCRDPYTVLWRDNCLSSEPCRWLGSEMMGAACEVCLPTVLGSGEAAWAVRPQPEPPGGHWRTRCGWEVLKGVGSEEARPAELSPSDAGERLGGPWGAASVHLSLGVKRRPGASDQMPKPFSPDRSRLCPPADKTSGGHCDPGGLGQRRLCASPEWVGPPPKACP